MHLEPGQVIAQTKQVNDLNSLETRQTSYTNKFKLPKTAHNTKALQFLTVTGNRSDVPYNKNECSLYSETGECFIYKGRAVITDGGTHYEAVIYDGVIDLFKLLENKTLGNLNFDLCNHEKSVAKVTESWTGVAPYLYIAADYNGHVFKNNNFINIDYLVPSMSVEFIWQTLFTTYNLDWAGSVFSTQAFKKLYLTYPKAIMPIESEAEVFNSADYTFTYAQANNPNNKYYAKYNTFTTLEGITTTDNIHFKPGVNGTYKVTISGRIQSTLTYVNQQEAVPTNFNLYFAKNAIGQNAMQATQVGPAIVYNHAPGDDFSKTLFLNLENTESFCIVAAATTPDARRVFGIQTAQSNLTVTISRVETGNVNFTDIFTDFPAVDFLKEILHRFGLTVFKDKYSSRYEFLTLQELLQNPDYEDWSHKFSRKISENYIYGNYAQKNYFRYNYNDKESTYNDGAIDVNNTNLPENRDVIKSKIYSPEKNRVKYLDGFSNVYKFWEKELVEATDDQPAHIQYKPLDKRYYFLYAERVEKPVIALSIQKPGLEPQARYYRESFNGLPFTNIIQNYYAPLQQVLSNSLVVTADVLLKDTDVINLDFRKLYYIEQLSSYFMLNKVTNYIPGKLTKCELIRVPYTAPSPPSVIIKIKKVVITGHDMVVHYVTSYQYAGLLLQTRQQDSDIWVNPAGGVSPISTWHPTGTYTIRIWANGFESNHVQVTIPDTITIEIP